MLSFGTFTFEKTFTALSYRSSSTVSRLQKPLRGNSLLLITRFPVLLGTHLVNLRRMKGWVELGATKQFWTWNTWIENPTKRSIFRSPSYTKSYSSFQTTKQNKNLLLVKNNRGCLILLAWKKSSQVVWFH